MQHPEIETGWVLRPFTAALAPGLTSPLDTKSKELKRESHKVIFMGLKNIYVYAQLGRILDPKDTKRPKTKTKTKTTATSEEPGARAVDQEQKQGIVHAPCTQHHLIGGQNT